MAHTMTTTAVPTTGPELLAWADEVDWTSKATSIRWLLLMWGSSAGYRGSIVGWDEKQVAKGWEWAAKHVGIIR